MADRLPPTPTAMLIATAILSLAAGYMIGIASSLGFIPLPFPVPFDFSSRAPRPGWQGPRTRSAGYHDEEESSAEEVDVAELGAALDHAPNWANGAEADQKEGLRVRRREGAAKKMTADGEERRRSGNTRPDWEDNSEEWKLVLVVRTDLGMTKGKIAAQCSHATLACYKSLLRRDPSQKLLRKWERQGQAKVALQVKSEEELETLQAKAISLGITAEVIADAGRTQIASGSHTVLGVGPAPKSVVDAVTGGLKLL